LNGKHQHGVFGNSLDNLDNDDCVGEHQHNTLPATTAMIRHGAVREIQQTTVRRECSVEYRIDTGIRHRGIGGSSNPEAREQSLIKTLR
jgi:hypothetical protein